MSDLGAQEHFRGPAAMAEQGLADGGRVTAARGSAGFANASGSRPIVVGEEAVSGGWGRGPVPTDTRKFRYDAMRALTVKPVQFAVSKADRLDPDEAGDVLHKIHVVLQIDKEDEGRLAAFDAALWWQHTINGASIMQDGRGSIVVDGMSFDISECLKMIGEKQLRKFFRAYADEIVEVNKQVLRAYTPYDPVAADKYGQLMQVAAARGLHKFPEYAFDAADACLNISMEVRRAIMTSKAAVIPTVNRTDEMFKRTKDSVNIEEAAMGVGAS